MADYTQKNLREVKDSAAEAGLSDMLEARFAHEDVGAEDTGFSFQVVKAGQRQPFAHKHGEAQEIYVVISGSGKLKLDDEVIDVERLDAIRIGPSTIRAFQAGDDDLELLVFGQRMAGDAEIVQDFSWD
jgi:mannose-6-phosphate isomerase-like protein (cupin superfamily)